MSGQTPAGGFEPMPGINEPVTPTQRGPAPATVANAVRIMFLRAAISLVSVITLFAAKGQLKTAIRKKNLDASPHRLDTLVNSAIIVAIVIAVIFIVLYVLLALQVGKGKNWARIVTWVIAALGVVSALASFGQTTTTAARIIGVISGLLDLVVIILLARRPSNTYFAGQPR